MTFLETVAAALYNRHKTYLHRLAVVFPNRRQSIFFRHYYMRIAEPPAFLPHLLTIEELVKASSALPVAENLLQSFGLYYAYRAVCIKEGDAENDLPDFEQFFPLGETLLKDFNEIETYLLNIREVCTTLYNIEMIEKAFDQLTKEQKAFLKQFWASVTNKGKAQERFLKLWKRLPAIAEIFYEGLSVKGYTTLGKAYRQLAEGSPTEPGFGQEWDHIAFVGFNALNAAEEQLLKTWQHKGFASLWVDCDAYYLNDTRQEAGYFIRRNLFIQGLKNELDPLQTIAGRNDEVTVTGVQGHTAQAKLIGEWLQKLAGHGRVDNAAILLADESLILPVLQSLPGEEVPVNVTMGFPLHQTAVFSFFKLYFNIQEELAKNNWRSVHFEWVQEWLNHPLCDWSESARTGIQAKIRQQVLIHVPLKYLQKHSTLGNLMLLRINAVMDVFGRMRQMLQVMQEMKNLQFDALMQGAMVASWQVLQSVEPLFDQLHPRPSFYLLAKVLRRQLSTVTIPFEGEPLRGIQVMGLLESRGLDFDHILVLGAAEGSLPRANPPQTFIPDGVRRAFGMPVPEFQDAIFAYVFYRLLHRSKSMALVYNALVSENSNGEPSRFVQQLAFETNMRLEYKFPGMQVQPAPQPIITINKTPEVMKILGKYLLTKDPVSFSPSQVNTYMACRLQFFFRQVAMLRKPDLFSDEIDPMTLGSIVHKLMERLYEAVKQHQHDWHITKASVKWMREQVPLLIEPTFRSVWLKDKAVSPVEFKGLLEVVKQVVEKYVEGFLNIDEDYAPFRVVSLEVGIPQIFAIEIDGRIKPVMLSGYIDRIDEKDGLYRMVDYKTGGDKTEFFSIPGLFERDGKKQNKAALQTLIYSWMFRKSFPEHDLFEPALIALREQNRQPGETRLFMKGLSKKVTAEVITEILPEIESGVRGLLEEIFDPAIPFDQTTNIKTCSFCDYAGICRRN